MKWLKYTYRGETQYRCEKCGKEYRFPCNNCPSCGAKADGITERKVICYGIKRTQPVSLAEKRDRGHREPHSPTHRESNTDDPDHDRNALRRRNNG